MEVTQVLLARVIQMLKPFGAAVYLPEIANKLKAKYAFVTAPRDREFEELVSSEPTQGAEFRHGRLVSDGRQIIVQQLTVFNDGVVVDTTTSTDDSDLFLTDLLQWAREVLPEAKPLGPAFYLSNLEIHTRFALEKYVPTFRPFGDKIGALLNGYGIEAPRYEVSAVTLFFDQIGKLAPQPGAFNLERRANVPYEKNIWFAQAPLRTADHINLLLDLEKQS
jgi:hypothetical protein